MLRIVILFFFFNQGLVMKIRSLSEICALVRTNVTWQTPLGKIYWFTIFMCLNEDIRWL